MLPEIMTSLALPERRAEAIHCQSCRLIMTGFRMPEVPACAPREKLTLEGGLVTQSDLTRLHHKCETGVEGVTGLGLLLGGHLDEFVRADLEKGGRSGDGCRKCKRLSIRRTEKNPDPYSEVPDLATGANESRVS